MCGFAFHQTLGRPSAHADEANGGLVSALFEDPDQAGRAYDMIVELGYANEEIRVVRSEGSYRTNGPAGGTFSAIPGGGIVLTVEPRTEEDARLLASRLQICRSPVVAGR